LATDALIGIISIDVRDCDITADALHSQTNTVQAMRVAGAHYTIGVKANQKTLYQDIISTFTTLQTEHLPTLPMYETVEKGHGRIETRRYWVTDNLSQLSTRDAWKDLQSIGKVEAERQIGTQVSHSTYPLQNPCLDGNRDRRCDDMLSNLLGE
jgi:predicted transposase YbfD/YdcC